jgi:hydroxymethylbilane synthase
MRALAGLHPGLEIRFEAVRTQGDDPASRPYGGSGVKGLFVKEIETALLEGRIDLAVHSAKDMAALLPAGLVLGAAPARETPWDALLSREGLTVGGLPAGSKVGTSSLRRGAFLRLARPDLEVVPLRGNVETRIKKLGRGCDAIILAGAALLRMDPPPSIPAGFGASDIPWTVLPPSPAQGQLALEHREGDARVSALLAPLSHRPSELALAAERALMRRLGLGCSAPVGALAVLEGGRLRIRAAAADLENRAVLVSELECPDPTPALAGRLGEEAAEDLLGQGARRLTTAGPETD